MDKVLSRIFVQHIMPIEKVTFLGCLNGFLFRKTQIDQQLRDWRYDPEFHLFLPGRWKLFIRTFHRGSRSQCGERPGIYFIGTKSYLGYTDQQSWGYPDI